MKILNYSVKRMPDYSKAAEKKRNRLLHPTQSYSLSAMENAGRFVEDEEQEQLKESGRNLATKLLL